MKNEVIKGIIDKIRLRTSKRILTELGVYVALVAITFLILKASVLAWIFFVGILIALYINFTGKLSGMLALRMVILGVSFTFLFMVGTITSGVANRSGDIKGFKLKVSKPWIIESREKDDLYVISKIDGVRTATVTAWYNKLDQNIYKEKNIDFDKVTQSENSGYKKISQEKIKIGQWPGVKMLLSANINVGDSDYYRYLYIMDVPGDKDVMVIIGAGGLKYIKTLGKQWEGHLKKIELNY